MIFLNPSILFGLIAAGIPLMIHLLNMKRLKKIEFSTLAFLKEIQKSKIKRVKIKQWVLLALRTFIIIFIVAAFARPTLQEISIGGTAPIAKSTSVFILDNSFSMSVVGEKGSYFNQAKQIIKDIIAQSVDGDEYALCLTSSYPKELRAPTISKDDFLKELNGAEISFVSGYLVNSFSTAGDILNRSSNLNKHIYLFTDFQKSSFKSNAVSSDYNGPQGVNIYNFNFAMPEPINLAVTRLVSNNQIFELNKEISLTATVNNFSDKKVNNNVASLFINGKREAQHSISLPPYGATQVTFETTLKDAGLVSIQCELEDDAILQDNARWLNIFVPAEINILMLADDLPDTKYLELALSPNTDAKQIRLTKSSTAQLESINLNKYSVIIIVGTGLIKNYSPLKKFISDGGKIILMPGNKSNFNDIKSTTSSLGLPQPTGIIGQGNVNFQISAFDMIDFKHPIFENLFDNDKQKEIESPIIYKYFHWGTQGLGKSIIDLRDRSSFLGEYNNGNGKVILFNIAPTLEWSNLPLKGIFSPLITNWSISSRLNREPIIITLREKRYLSTYAADQYRN